MTGCIDHHDYGPQGRDGNAYYGVDFHFNPPFSYWDNNPSIPEKPYLGEFYWTHEGVYDFEYFINPYDYWYGTYTVYRNYGTDGGPYHEAGLDGLDTYLMLFCDPNGWHEDRFEYKENVTVQRYKDRLQIDVEEDEARFSITLIKTDVIERPTLQKPKWKEDMLKK